MKRILPNTQRGQALVLVALGIIAFLAILALVLDGGTTFAVRRQMQNAADAGALAGARALCLRPKIGCSEGASDATCATFFAKQYATVHNTAQNAQVSIFSDEDTKQVVVTATRDVNTFFAHFIGHDQIPVQASAAAACCPPSWLESVLPVAWACRSPINDEVSDNTNCQEQIVPTVAEANDLRVNNPPEDYSQVGKMYIIMDSNAEPTDLRDICQPDGWLKCDLDGDGEPDLIANGDKSWLDLNGGGSGANELKNWIKDGYGTAIDLPTWTGGQSGTENSVFQAAADKEGQVVYIPVFTKICDGRPDEHCPSDYQSPPDHLTITAGGNYYYKIVTFAAFYISCVNASGVTHAPDTAVFGNECPGHKIAREQGIFADVTGGNNVHNPKTIEGYFVPYVASGGGGDCTGGVDVGLYTISIIK